MPAKKSDKIDLNSAGRQQLERLPGIGPDLAGRILAYRREHGPIDRLEALSAIPGISRKLIDRLAGLVVVGPAMPEGAPLTFHGRAGRMGGTIALAAPLQSDLQIGFAKTELRTKQGRPLTDLQLRYPARFINGEALRLKVPLSRHTPPGTHEVELLVNGERRRAVFEVEERLSARLSPTRLFLEGAPGAVLNKTVYLANQGNVPLTFGDPGPVVLETGHLECRALRDVVRRLDKKEGTLDRAAALFADKLETLYDEAGALKVRLRGDPVTIAPGTMEKIELVIQLPAGLKRPNTYSGAFLYYNATLSFQVTPTAKATVRNNE